MERTARNEKRFMRAPMGTAGWSSIGSADGPLCDKYIATFKKAAAKAGKSMDGESVQFWKKACANSPNAEIEAFNKCMDAAKSDADMNTCLKG